MKKILISVRPEQVENILNLEQSLIVRKTMPKCKLPCEVYIYCTKGKKELKRDYLAHTNKRTTIFDIWTLNGTVVAKFTLKETINYGLSWLTIGNENGTTGSDLRYLPHPLTDRKSCLSQNDILKYGNLKRILYGWCIDDLEIFDEPKTLADYGLEKAPQSWCYVIEKE